MKTKTFLIPRVVQVPTGVWQVALQNWKALHETLDFSFLAARFFISTFSGPFDKSLSQRLDGGLCMILGTFNILCVFVSKLVWVRFDVGHEASIFLAMLAALLFNVKVQSLLPLLDNIGVLAVLAMLPY